MSGDFLLILTHVLLDDEECSNSLGDTSFAGAELFEISTQIMEQAQQKLHSKSLMDFYHDLGGKKKQFIKHIFRPRCNGRGRRHRDQRISDQKPCIENNILGSLEETKLQFTVLLQHTKILQNTGIHTVFFLLVLRNTSFCSVFSAWESKCIVNSIVFITFLTSSFQSKPAKNTSLCNIFERTEFQEKPILLSVIFAILPARQTNPGTKKLHGKTQVLAVCLGLCFLQVLKAKPPKPTKNFSETWFYRCCSERILVFSQQ